MEPYTAYVFETGYYYHAGYCELVEPRGSDTEKLPLVERLTKLRLRAFSLELFVARRIGIQRRILLQLYSVIYAAQEDSNFGGCHEVYE